jgi:hypothetical protein
MGSGAKSYMRKGVLIYAEMRKYLNVYVEAVSHIRLCSPPPIPSKFPYTVYEENFKFLFISDSTGVLHILTLIKMALLAPRCRMA